MQFIHPKPRKLWCAKCTKVEYSFLLYLCTSVFSQQSLISGVMSCSDDIMVPTEHSELKQKHCHPQTCSLYEHETTTELEFWITEVSMLPWENKEIYWFNPMTDRPINNFQMFKKKSHRENIESNFSTFNIWQPIGDIPVHQIVVKWLLEGNKWHSDQQ